MRIRAFLWIGCAALVASPGSAFSARRAVGQRQAAGAARSTGDWLTTGRLVGSPRTNDKAGKNASEIIALRDDEGTPHRALFKPRAGEQHIIPGVESGTYYLREVAVSELASALGVPFFPKTVKRTVRGRVGSAMEWVDGAIRAHDADPEGWQVNRAEGELLRVMDFLIGNVDWHAKNLLFKKDGDGVVHPIAIDNGLAFPQVHLLNWNLSSESKSSKFFDAPGPLLQSTRDFITKIDPERVAEVLARNRIEPVATAATLRRLARLKADPSFLQTENSDQVRDVGLHVEEGLSELQLDGIHDLVAKAYGLKNR